MWLFAYSTTMEAAMWARYIMTNGCWKEDSWTKSCRDIVNSRSRLRLITVT